MWLRDSSFVARPRRPDHGRDRLRRRAGQAPRSRARRCEMTTLHVRDAGAARARPRTSRRSAALKAPDFPHALTIQVIERQPVAALAADGERRIPVTGDGVVLRGVTAERDLPSLVLDSAGDRPEAHRPARAARAGDRRRRPRRAAARARASSTSASAAWSSSLEDGPNWCSVPTPTRARSGSRRRACWPRARPPGATYLDLRIPGRVAAGGLAPVEPEPTRTRTLNLRLRMAQLSTRG